MGASTTLTCTLHQRFAILCTQVTNVVSDWRGLHAHFYFICSKITCFKGEVVVLWWRTILSYVPDIKAALVNWKQTTVCQVNIAQLQSNLQDIIPFERHL
jgi:hypothetical protein